jgi:CBS domain-containing protein
MSGRWNKEGVVRGAWRVEKHFFTRHAPRATPHAMICPTCGWDNLPGSEECQHCQQDLTPLDRPMAHDRVERSLMEDSVRLLQPKSPVTVRSSATVGEAVRIMFDQKLGSVLVVNDAGHLQGIFSERDLLKKVVGIHLDFAGLPISRFMTTNPERVTLGDTLNFALHKMDVGGYRHLPVVEAGRPVGVISVRDMLRHITRLCKDH